MNFSMPHAVEPRFVIECLISYPRLLLEVYGNGRSAQDAFQCLHHVCLEALRHTLRYQKYECQCKNTKYQIVTNLTLS